MIAPSLLRRAPGRKRLLLLAAGLAALVGWSTVVLTASTPGPRTPGSGPSRWQLTFHGEDEVALACSSAHFCLVLSDGSGEVHQDLVYDGSRWAATNVKWPWWSPEALACPADGHCLAVDTFGQVSTLDGGKWSPAKEIDNSGGLTDATTMTLACSSPSFCMLVDGLGRAVTYNGTSWSASTTVDTDYGFTSLSCVTGDVCVAVDGGGEVFTYSGGHWSPFRTIDADALTSVACAAPGSCVATDIVGRVLSSHGGRWSQPLPLGTASGGPLALSCPLVGYCIAFNGVGEGYVLARGRWRAETLDTLPVPAVPRAAEIACAPGEVGFCATAIGFGQVEVGTNPFSATGPVVHTASLL